MKSINLGFTAELAALIKAERDPDYHHFVSERTRRIIRVIKLILPARTIRDISTWRLKLSDLIDQEIAKEQPAQIVELGCGYSLRGLKLAMKDPGILLIDSDRKDVIDKKRELVTEILDTSKSPWPANYRLLTIDVLTEDLIAILAQKLDPQLKTIIFAEGVTTFFDQSEFAGFLSNIGRLLVRFTDARFLSHDRSRPRSAFYGLIRWMLAFATQRRGHRFDTLDELKVFLAANSGCAVQADEKDGFITYSLRPQASAGDEVRLDNKYDKSHG